MAIYPSNSTSIKQKIASKKQKLGLFFVVFFSSMLFNLLFEFMSFINKIFLGVFGLSTYAIFLFFIGLGILLFLNKKISISKTAIILLVVALFSIVALLHIATTAEHFTTFSEYLTYCYNYKMSAGGALTGFFVYPIYFVMHLVGVYVFYALVLVVLITVILDYFYTNNKNYKSVEDLITTIDKERFSALNDIKNPSAVITPNMLPANNSDSIFIKDEIDNDDVAQKTFTSNKDKDKIKRLLGLNNDEEEENERQIEEENKEKKRERIIDSFTLQDNKKKNRPEKIIHIEDEMDASPIHTPFDIKPEKVLSERERKNLDFVKMLRGEMPQSPKQEPKTSIYNDNSNQIKQDFDYNPYEHNEEMNEFGRESNMQDFSSFDAPSEFRNQQNNFDNNYNNNYEDGHNNAMNNSNYLDKNNRKNYNNKNMGSGANYNNSQKDGGFNAPNNMYQNSKNPQNDYKNHNFNQSFTPAIVNGMQQNNQNGYNNENGNFDIYDNNLTLKSYEKNKVGLISNLDKSNNSFKSTSMPARANEYYSGKVNENRVEPKGKTFEQIKIIPPNETIKKAKYTKPPKYIKPPISLLNDVQNKVDVDGEDYQLKAEIIENKLKSFRIPATVHTITKGPTFTQFEMQMPAGIPVKKITSYIDDIAMELESDGKIRIEIPIPGKNAFGIEVPNKVRDIVGLREVLDSYSFQGSKSPLTIALGKDISSCQVAKLEKMPHLLVAGATNSGKSVCLNALIVSLLYKSGPEDVRLLLIDPKRVEFTMYNNLPHLLVPNVITELDKTLKALDWCVNEMERRFILFSNSKARNITEYNSMQDVQNGLYEKLPYIVIIIDELADFMVQAKKDMEERITRLAAKSRAAGIHLVLATQRPSVDVITGLIKSNLPTRIAFMVSAGVDSRTILDQVGAEKLLGKGDMLYSASDSSEMPRIQGAFVDINEVESVVNFVKENNPAMWDESIEDAMFNDKKGFDASSGLDDDYDVYLKDATRNAIRAKNISVSAVQRMFGVGYPRAGKIIDQMVRLGFISEPDNKNARVIFVTQQEFEEKFGEDL